MEAKLPLPTGDKASLLSNTPSQMLEEYTKKRQDMLLNHDTPTKPGLLFGVDSKFQEITEPIDLDAYLQARQDRLDSKDDNEKAAVPPTINLDDYITQRGGADCYAAGSIVINKACYQIWGRPCQHRVTLDGKDQGFWYAPTIVQWMQKHTLRVPDHFESFRC